MSAGQRFSFFIITAYCGDGQFLWMNGQLTSGRKLTRAAKFINYQRRTISRFATPHSLSPAACP